MPERYPGYDVLNKRNSPSWNDQTRRAIDERLAIDPDEHQFFADMEWPTIRAVCERIVPQTVARPRPVPLAAMIDKKCWIMPATVPAPLSCPHAGGLAPRFSGARPRGEVPPWPPLS